jgi:aspartokinase-like uncharacterized kinase
VTDPFFIPFIIEHHISATILNGSVPGRLTQFLEGKEVPGTKTGTTF